MEFHHRDFYDVPPPRFYRTSTRFSFAPFSPPPPYYYSYHSPPFDAACAPLPPPSDYGYYSSRAFRARMLDYRHRSEESVAGHNLIVPNRPCRDPFLDREYERERIREEILREEVRRRILEEEVRWELEMERYYGLRHSNLGCQETWPAVQLERPRFSDGYYTRGPRGQAPRNQFKARRWVRNVQHKIMEINEGELMSKPPVSEDKAKPSNEEGIQKKKDEQTVQTEENGNKVERNVSETPHKIMEVTEEERRPRQALLKDKVQSPKNPEELRSKASLPEKTLPKDKCKPPANRKNFKKKWDGNKVLKPDSGNKIGQLALSKGPLPEVALPKDKIKPPPTRNNIEKEGDGNNVLKPESGNKVQQLAFSQFSKELYKETEACRSKRKADSISALPTPATTRGSIDKVGLKKAKKQKIEKKEYNCTLCQVTVYGDDCWLGHLNGKRHRNTLKRLVEMNKKVSSDIDKKSTPSIGLAAVKVEMDNCDSLGAKPTREQLQIDKGKIKKMQVGREVHEVVEKENQLWCERCQYKCTTTVMMTIHLVSEKHKVNRQKQ